MKAGDDQEILRKFGDNLKRIRKRKGFSLRALSYECSIDFSDIGKIERGQTNITLLTIMQLAKALEIPAEDLFKWEN